MFKAGRRALLILPRDAVRRFRGALFSLGYTPHIGPRSKRDGETQAWVLQLDNGRQVHVQEVRRMRQEDERVEIYAHTEPAGTGPAHIMAAVLDQASYAAGARILREQLREKGWRA